MPTSVKRIAGQSFKFGWTHTNLAEHNTFIRTDTIKKAGLFTLFGSFSWKLLLIYLEKAALSRQNTTFGMYDQVGNVATITLATIRGLFLLDIIDIII